MTSLNKYPPIPSALPEALGPHLVEVPPQVAYHLKVVQAKRRGLINKEAMFRRNTRSTLRY